MDVLCDRESSTVRYMSTNILIWIILSEGLGLEIVKLRMGPWDVDDKSGIKISIVMLWASQENGRNSSKYIKFDYIQTFSPFTANIYKDTPIEIVKGLVFNGERGNIYRATRYSTDTLLFKMFSQICEKSTGPLFYQDLGLSMEIVMGILEMIKNELYGRDVVRCIKIDLIVAESYFVIFYVGVLWLGVILLTKAFELVRWRRNILKQ